MIDQQLARLGPLEHTSRISSQSGWPFLIIAVIITAAVVFWLLRYVNAPLCVPVPLSVFAWVGAEFFIKRRTELRIHEHGLIYQRLFKKHTIFWKEVEEYGHVLRKDYEMAGLHGAKGNRISKATSIRGGADLVWLQTHTGEKFYLRADLENIKIIIDHISVKLYGEPYYGPLVNTTKESMCPDTDFD